MRRSFSLESWSHRYSWIVVDPLNTISWDRLWQRRYESSVEEPESGRFEE